MRRRSLLLASAALLGAAPPACSGGPTASLAVGTEAGATYVLRRVDGRPLPARVSDHSEGYEEILADTLRFGTDGRVHISGAVHSVIRQPFYARDTVVTPRWDRGYLRDGDRVTIGTDPCDDVIIRLASCVGPDTGSFRGDSLVLATEAPDAPRRAYVRLTPAP